MAVQDIVNDLNFVETLAQTAIGSSTDTFGSAVDTANVEKGVMHVMNIPDLTDGTWAITVQDSDDGSTGWADVDAEKLQNTPAALTAVGTAKVGAFSTKRYQRIKITSTGVTTGATVGAFAVSESELVPTV